MNVGTITIHNHHNYGAVLQAYALRRVIERIGHRCRIIDCDIDPGRRRQFRWAKHPGAQIASLYNAWRRRANHLHDRRFMDFRSKHLALTGKSYRTLSQLVEAPPDCQAFVTGSDQVWRPALLDRGVGHAFHLCFSSSERIRRIAYAPSFGVNAIPEAYAPIIRFYLLRYHALSVREKRGQEIISALSGRDAEQTLDPSLLLSAEEYAPIAAPPRFKGPYVLVYPTELGHAMSFLRLVKEVKRQTRLPLVCLFPLDFNFRWVLAADKVVLDAGPSEFLGWFQQAAMVCTNSFHGTAFSLIYGKPFLSVPHSSTNSRIHSLLEQVGLTNRQLADPSQEKVRAALDEPIDYARVNLLLHTSVRRSISFLEGALQS